MYQIDFKHPEAKIYFCGIGGSSMSGLAGMMKHLGFTVWGSDRSESPHTWQAEKEGIRVIIGQKSDNITDDIDCAVFTAAISPDNPEYQAVLAKNIPHITRAQLLGQIMDQFPKSIAISGTHGKTTTTSMISEILRRNGSDPSFQIGAILNSVHTSYHTGSSELFVAEACEYTNSFLSMRPYIGIIMNIEEDHLDFFKDIDDIRHSFRKFAENIHDDGWLIICSDIPNLEEITEGLSCHIVRFGKDKDHDDYYAEDVSYNNNAELSFTCHAPAKEDRRITLKVPGKQYIADALAAIAACDICGAEDEAILASLYAFEGSDRRFQYKGTCNGFKIIDDYAHHPTQIRVTIEAAKHIPHNRLYACYEPHTYTRTKALMNEYIDALATADEVLLVPVFAARETDTLGVTIEAIAEKVEAKGTPCHCFNSIAEAKQWVLSNLKENDLLVSMGAGSIYQLADDLVHYEYDFPEENQ